jgi:hypothetical protein
LLVTFLRVCQWFKLPDLLDVWHVLLLNPFL